MDVFDVGVLIVLSIIFIGTFGIIATNIRDYDDFKPEVGTSQLIPITKRIDEVTVYDIQTTETNQLKPLVSFTPTVNVKIKPFTTQEVLYEHQCQYEIIKKGKDKYLWLHIPEYYYNKEDYKVMIDDITIRVYYKQKEKETVEPSFETTGYDPQTTYEYVIISTETFYPIINNEFVNWKVSTDDKISNILLTNITDITSNPAYYVNGSYGDATNETGGNHWITDGKEVTTEFDSFNDTQAKIRNFLRYCYDTYSTSYVLLVGNKNVVPPRMVCSYAWSGEQYYNDTSHASDMYYACLHNSMNNNTNSRWMENKVFGSDYDDIDWGYDLCVGRAPIDTTNDLYNWINKTKAYHLGQYQGNYLSGHIVATKDSDYHIWSVPWNYYLGDEFKDSFAFLNDSYITSTQWNDLDDYVNGLNESWDGFQYIYHCGHGGTLWSPYSSSNCYNTDTPQFVYTEGCSTADFGTDTSSRMESWISDNGCAFAGVANSAYGWFVASTFYGEEMMKQMFNETEGNLTTIFCQAHNDAREIFGHPEDSVFGMIVKETNFFGDPAMEYNEYIGTPPQFITMDGQENGTLVYNSTPTINWSTSDDTSMYWLQISTQQDFSVLEVNLTDINEFNYPAYCSIGDTVVTFQLPPENALSGYDTYYIRVRPYRR